MPGGHFQHQWMSMCKERWERWVWESMHHPSFSRRLTAYQAPWVSGQNSVGLLHRADFGWQGVSKEFILLNRRDTLKYPESSWVVMSGPGIPLVSSSVCLDTGSWVMTNLPTAQSKIGPKSGSKPLKSGYWWYVHPNIGSIQMLKMALLIWSATIGNVNPCQDYTLALIFVSTNRLFQMNIALWSVSMNSVLWSEFWPILTLSDVLGQHERVRNPVGSDKTVHDSSNQWHWQFKFNSRVRDREFLPEFGKVHVWGLLQRHVGTIVIAPDLVIWDFLSSTIWKKSNTCSWPITNLSICNPFSYPTVHILSHAQPWIPWAPKTAQCIEEIWLRQDADDRGRQKKPWVNQDKSSTNQAFQPQNWYISIPTNVDFTTKQWGSNQQKLGIWLEPTNGGDKQQNWGFSRKHWGKLGISTPKRQIWM